MGCRSPPEATIGGCGGGLALAAAVQPQLSPVLRSGDLKLIISAIGFLDVRAFEAGIAARQSNEEAPVSQVQDVVQERVVRRACLRALQEQRQLAQ